VFFELRQYRIFPGKREQWVKFMEERIMPGQLAHGVVIVGSFVGHDEADLYAWIRRFESEAHLAAVNATYYQSHEWQHELLPMAKQMNDMSRMVVTRLGATPRSVIQ
jgi:NIPSNAP